MGLVLVLPLPQCTMSELTMLMQGVVGSKCGCSKCPGHFDHIIDVDIFMGIGQGRAMSNAFVEEGPAEFSLLSD